MSIEAAAEVLGARAQRDAPIGPMTTYRVGGHAALLVRAEEEADLALAARAVAAGGLPVLVVGRGSNLLVSDRGFAGLALVLGPQFDAIETDATIVRAGGATALPALARQTAAAGLTGLEWAVGVPGSVGGAVRMNAGGHGSDIAATIRRAGIADLGADGIVEVVDAADLDLAYRRSAVGPAHVVSWAEFALRPGDRGASEAEIREIVRWRREHQPGGSNAGSVFTNPPGDSAGRLIDAAGLKGFRVGSAFVSPKHANFFQADEGGSADDVAALIGEVQRQVEATTGVRLHPELRMIGFPA
ncbi:MAG: murB [Acidimicrobiales bacterium]|nr:murB [Acidimicrobiales bacterium]